MNTAKLLMGSGVDEKLDARYCVYIHRKLTTNEIFYVGKGLPKRPFNKSQRNDYWKRIEAKHGRSVEIVERNLLNDEALSLEVELIDILRKEGVVLCNLTDGGEGVSGCLHTEEYKIYMSESQKGKVISEEHKQAMRKPKSEEGRLAIREAQNKLRASGYRPSDESNIKRSITLQGRIITESHANKIAEALRGKPKNKVECPTCGKVGGVGLMHRWHFDNCRLKLEEVA